MNSPSDARLRGGTAIGIEVIVGGFADIAPERLEFDPSESIGPESWCRFAPWFRGVPRHDQFELRDHAR